MKSEPTTNKKKPIKIEEVTEDQLRALGRYLGTCGAMVAELGDVDISKGRGVLSENGRQHCLWTHKGHRVTVDALSTGGVIASVSKEPDPDMP